MTSLNCAVLTVSDTRTLANDTSGDLLVALLGADGHQLVDRALEVARRENIVAHQGVFVAVPGPNLETRAEYRFLRVIGADVVGMSTVPEVIVAVHCGLRVVGFSIVTDMCLPDALEPANVAKIIAVANAAEPKLCSLVMGVLEDEGRGTKDEG